MKRSFWLLLGLAVPVAVFASDLPVEDSMVVTGTITVNPQGGVASYSVRDLDKLPPAARQIVQTMVPRWQFVPIIRDGKAISATAGMSLRIVADMVDANHAKIRVADAEFGCDGGLSSAALPDACPAGVSVSYDYHAPPRYPSVALRDRVGGEVFLVLEIGRDGRVMNAAARQVNLFSLIKEQAFYRTELADAALRAARRWRFHVPTVGPDATQNHWIVEVPVNYVLVPYGSRAERIKYGQWKAYVPGPVQHIPWDDEDKQGGSGGSADAIAGGALFLKDTRFVLKTPLAGGAGQS